MKGISRIFSGRATVVVLCTCLFFVVSPKSAAAFTAPEWLFAVEQPVLNQTSTERNRVAQEGLLAILTRITGLVSVPRTEQVRAALSNPSRYYSEFKFFEADDEMMLRVTYQKSAIMNLVRSSGLPIWWTSRPTVLVWIVIEENGQRRILSAESEHPLKAELSERARVRGLELRLPLMDVDDELTITPGEVWGDVAASVEAASERYDADLTMTCRMQARLSLQGRALDGDCRYWFDDRPAVRAFSTDQFTEVAVQAVDGIADQMVGKYSVLARELRRWKVRIKGVADVAQYAALMRHVEQLDFVDQVAISELEGEHLTFLFDTRADADQFLMLLTSNDVFIVDDFNVDPGVQLIWRG